MMLSVIVFLAVTYISLAHNCDHDFKSNPNIDEIPERIYYIACVEEEWDYAPSGKNLVTGKQITESSPEGTWLWGNEKDRIGPKYMKALYREFTNNCFKEQEDLGEKYQHLGSLGPPIRAITGETIKIFYKNMCSFPTSMHPHGVFYEKLSEGAPYVDDDGINGGDIVKPGDSWVYLWEARERMIDKGTSSKMWLYHSHVDEVKDLHSGLFGPIIITQKGYERSLDDLMPRDVSREFVTFYVLYDENESLLFDQNVDKYLDNPSDELLDDADFIESNLMHSINGYLFGNLDQLTCTGGEMVRWYTASFGNEQDGPHSPHWHGNIGVDTVGENTDTVVLIPGTTLTVSMTIDAPGTWLMHCHVFDHITAGMITTYTADPFPDDHDVDDDDYYYYYYDSETENDDEDQNDNDEHDGHAMYCCNGKTEKMRGRCLDIVDEDKCNGITRYCEWDESNCLDEITCDLRGTACAGNPNLECCSGYCNAQNVCS